MLMFHIGNHGIITVGMRKKHIIVNHNNLVIPSINIKRLHIVYDA